MTRKYSTTSVATTLSAGIASGTTSITVPTGTGTLLMGGVSLAVGNVDQFLVALDVDTNNEEIVAVTGISGDTLTVVRGQAGTSAIAHTAGASVKHVFTGDDATFFTAGVATANAAIPKSVVTTKGDLVTATASATPARLGVGSNNQVLIADSTTATGLKWGTVSATPRIGQVVQTLTTTTTSTTSTSYVDATNMTATITPTIATSKVLVTINFASNIDARIDTGIAWAKYAIIRGATQLYELKNLGLQGTMSSGAFSSNNNGFNVTLTYLDSPATTSATTYKLQFARIFSGTIFVNDASGQGTVTLQEVLV
jgi:hypothetical protein